MHVFRYIHSSHMKKNLSTILKFFHSERGRRYILYASAGGAGTIGWVYCSCQTFWIDRYKNFLQLYKNGLVTPVSPQVLERTAEVLNDTKLDAKSKAYIRFFSIFGFDSYHVGSTKTRHGAYVGLPANFSYKSPSDIEKNTIRVGDVPVSWDTDEGRLLQGSIILSPNAQKFAIAREIAHTHTYHIYFHAGIHSTAFFMYSILAHAANDKFYGLYKPASFRITVYTLIGTFTFGLWAVSRDILTKYYENYADRRASSLGFNYAKGGAEFYTKLIQRNIALRGLMGSDGDSRYTAFGNDVEFLRQKHVPFSVRKQNAENVVKEYYNKMEELKSQPAKGNQSS